MLCSERVEPERVDVDCCTFVLCELPVVLRVTGRGSVLESSSLVLVVAVVLRVTERGSGLEFSCLVVVVAVVLRPAADPGSGLEVAADGVLVVVGVGSVEFELGTTT